MIYRALLFLLISTSAIKVKAQLTMYGDVVNYYTTKLDSLIYNRQEADRQSMLSSEKVKLDPYFYRLMAHGTLYYATLSRLMDVDWTFRGNHTQGSALTLNVDYRRSRVADITALTDRHFASVYVNDPVLIVNTEGEFRQVPRLRSSDDKPLQTDAKIIDRVVAVDLGVDVEENVFVEARRPNFWTLSGSGSLQFTQSYFTDNWYQGGEKNFAGQTSFTLQADFDNKQKIQWENKLEVQLGFQTSSDTVHKAKVTNNLLRYTTSLGYQASTNWYYTGSLQTYTQIMRNYNANAYTYTSGFSSPLYLTISVGMTYKFNTKNSVFSGSLLLSPVAYTMRYVACDSLRSYHSVEDGKRAYHNFGPSLTLNTKLVPCKNVTWESRLYYFTNLGYVDFEWENTFTFTINKFLSSKLFVYPRFDDSSSAYKGDHDYWMFKEWVSLGLSFDF